MEKEKTNLQPNPSGVNVGSEEGEKDVTSKKIEESTSAKSKEEDQELEKEIESIMEKLDKRGALAEKEKETEEEKKEEKKENNEEEVKDLADKLTLEEVNEITGRKFENKEDFIKHYKNLASFSGSDDAQEMRRKAKEYDKMMEDAGKIEELLGKKKEEKKEQKKEEKKDQTPEEIITLQKEITELKEKSSRDEFLKKYPEAEPYFKTIEAIAKRDDKELGDVYEGSDLQTLIAANKELQEVKQKEQDLGVNSKSRLAPTKRQKVADLVHNLKQAEKGGSIRDIDDLTTKLVEEYLDIGLDNQK